MAKPTAESHAARRPVHPIVERAKTSNESPPCQQGDEDLRVIERHRLQVGVPGRERARCAVQTTPTTTPIVKNSQPTTTAREFIASSTCSDGSRA